jgi:hypothetical protein
LQRYENLVYVARFLGERLSLIADFDVAAFYAEKVVSYDADRTGNG